MLVVQQRQLEGPGSTVVYNHSKSLNAGYILKEEQRPIVIVAVMDIAEGEEVAVDYSRGGSNSLWFVPLPEA